MTTLTERYLAAVASNVPTAKRADVERELRSSIADAIDDRLAAGEDPATAERVVLEGMGDPARLAAGMSGRPMYLIGPELFLNYRRLLIALLGIVVPLAAVALAVVEIAQGGGVEDAIDVAISTAINVAIQTAFWVTLVFVVVERVEVFRNGGQAPPSGRWTVDELPQLPSTRISVSDTIGELITLLVTIGGFVLLRGISLTDADTGQQVPLLQPAVDAVWLPALMVVLVALTVFRIALHLVGGWTQPLAVAHAAIDLAFAVPVIYLALSGMLINPAFATEVGYPQLAHGDAPAMILTAFGVALVTAWEIFDSFRQAARNKSARATVPLT